MEYLKKIVDFVQGMINNQNKKKLVENCVIVIIIGAILLIAASSFFDKKTSPKTTAASGENTDQAVAKILGSGDEKEDLQKKVESIVSKIGGAGNVNVLITYASGKELVPAYDNRRTDNDTQEKDNGGGTRSIRNSEADNKIAYEESGSGIKKPIILKELQPSVKGVVVVADGAADPVVRESIFRAVQALLDVPIHKIQVLPRNK